MLGIMLGFSEKKKIVPNAELLVSQPRVDGHRSAIDFLDKELWVSAKIRGKESFQLLPNIETFIPVLALIAAESGLDLKIDAGLDDAYFAGLNYGFAPFVSSLYGSRRPVISRRCSSNTGSVPKIGGSALLFSGGIDSFYSLKCLMDGGTRPDFLINIHAGAHDDNRKTWDVRLENIEAIGEKLGIPVIEIDTNFHLHYRDHHVRCATIRNIAACLALSPTISTFYFSSAVAYEDISFKVARDHGIHFIDYAATANILPVGVRVVELGYDASRTEKTAAVTQLSLSHNHLDVCTDQPYQSEKEQHLPINCGRCAKCLRTIATLEHQGNLDKFACVFALETWRTSKRQALEYLASSHEPLDQDVLEFFKSELEV